LIGIGSWVVFGLWWGFLRGLSGICLIYGLFGSGCLGYWVLFVILLVIFVFGVGLYFIIV
jgi:hypothetical protein